MKAQRLDLHPGVQGRSYSHDMWPRRSLHEPPGSLSVLSIHPDGLGLVFPVDESQ
jgi:hypothetical protein